MSREASGAARLAAGVAAGAAIACVDAFAFGGEVSPIVVIFLLFAATFIAGAVWGRRGWVAATATTACVPLAHLAKHLLGLPDTLHPNTYLSIFFLAAVCCLVGGLGLGCGVLSHMIGARERPREIDRDVP